MGASIESGLLDGRKGEGEVAPLRLIGTRDDGSDIDLLIEEKGKDARRK
jgi:hypothetical protein